MQKNIPHSSPLRRVLTYINKNTDKHAYINTTPTQKSHIKVKYAEVQSVHVAFGFDMDNELVVPVVSAVTVLR